jgi:hypothetical protein
MPTVLQCPGPTPTLIVQQLVNYHKLLFIVDVHSFLSERANRTLKRPSHEIFDLWFFFHKSTTPIERPKIFSNSV